MIYPNFLKEKDIIGITAPSDGITEEVDVYRLNNAIRNFNKKKFIIKETPDVRKSFKGKSEKSKTQAMELENLYTDNSVNAIICASGGDFMLEMISEINFEIIKDNPKWIQGYSDPTSLLYIITTNYDIATIYGDNFKAFGMKKWHESLENNLKILKGNILEQKSFTLYESKRQDRIIGDEEYNLDSKVKWENLNKEKSISIRGRIIGGCIDILSEIFGTRFDKTKEFIEKYKKDGIIWYFDNCELSSEELIRTIWKFKDNNWFKHCKGIVFGRSGIEKSGYNISFKEAVERTLLDLNIPIIINADFGHVSPRMTIINGAIANIESKNGKGKINLELI